MAEQTDVLDSVLQERLQELKKNCRAFAEGLRQQRGAPWFFGDVSTETVPGLADRAGWRSRFSRQASESLCTRARDNPAAHTRQDVALAIAQSDLLSGMERDLRWRRRGRIRRLAHESLGRENAGTDSGLFDVDLLRYLQRQAERKRGQP